MGGGKSYVPSQQRADVKSVFLPVTSRFKLKFTFNYKSFLVLDGRMVFYHHIDTMQFSQRL